MKSQSKFHGTERCARWLVHWAARGAPDCLSERLEEEWLADLGELRSGLSRLRFALGCCWATTIIARDHRLVANPAISVQAANSRSIGLGPHDDPVISRRTVTLLLVAGLHIVVFYVFAQGLGERFHKSIPTKFETRIIDSPRVRELPTPAGPKFSPTRILLVPPEVPPIESEAREEVDAAAFDPKHSLLPQPPPASAKSPVTRRLGGPRNGFPRADDFYPLLAVHMGETGTATVRACVNADGRLSSDPTIVQSTHSAALDEGALKLARAGSGHFRPTTEDGRAVDSCYAFRIRFDVKN
jgi:TonB family protein